MKEIVTEKHICDECKYYWQNCDTENECQGEVETCHEFILMNISK